MAMNLTSKREFLKRFYEPFGVILANLGVHPNIITLFSVVLGIFSAIAFYTHHPLSGAIALALSGLLDLSDGTVARLNNKTSFFGAVFDWIADKLVDGLVLGFLALAYLGGVWAILLVTVNMLHTFIKPVAYAELGCEKKEKGKINDPLEGVGFFGRPETHLAIISFALLEKFIPNALSFGLILILVFTTLSLLLRLSYLYIHYKS
jgi:phosphatidylglycerophosphate synthase